MLSNNKNRDVWIDERFSKRKPSLRIFCFPYAGGSSQIFRTWSTQFPDEIELCPIQLPGRGSRFEEVPYRQIAPLITALAEVILPRMDRPCAFFGHSMGSIIAYELAQHLKQTAGVSLCHLFVSGRGAPHLPRRSTPIYNLPEMEFLEELRQLNGTPEEVFDDRELLQLLIPLLRADFELIETYRFAGHSPLECPITAIGGLSDVEITREDIEAWSDHTASDFSAHMLPGDHFFIGQSEAFLLQIVIRQLYNKLTSGAFAVS